MCRILVVDEQAVVRELVAEVLSQRGHETVCADTADDAIAFLQENHVDVVLMESPPGGRARRDLLGRMRAEERLRGTPVVVLDGAGVSGDEPARWASPTGAVARVDRSRFRLDDLLARVDECLGLARGAGEDRRSGERVRTKRTELSVHLNGMGPWEVVDVSAAGLGVVAGVRLEVGQGVSALLRDGTSLYGGRMRVCNRVGHGGGRHRYGLRVVERASVLGRALALVRTP